MPNSDHRRVFVTGASGQLGQLVIDSLLARVPADRIVAGVRSIGGEPAKHLRSMGVEVRAADYNEPAMLNAAFAGVDRVLLISSSEEGRRVGEHRNVIEAAGKADIGMLAYTSLLHADTSPLAIAEDHRSTEAALLSSGLACAVLRNGWYTENYAASIGPALEHGAFLGCAGAGRIASASRIDYAEAAATVLTSEGHAGRVYELAGDEAYTLAEFTAAIAEASGRTVAYKDLSEGEFKAALLAAGLPEGLAKLLSDSDAGAARGGLNEGGRALSSLIGRPTTPYRSVILDALRPHRE